jgi:pyruvate dehydrogenase E1 component alpha subunit
MLSTLCRLSASRASAHVSALSRAYSTDVATYETRVCDTHKIDPPGTAAELTKDQAFDYLEKMMTIRRMETSAGELYRAKKIRGFCHLYSGQEALCVGMVAGLDMSKDGITSAYRCHGWAYTLGTPVDQVISELLGNANGCSGGKGGSMHMYGDHFYGGNGIVGAQVPIAAGIGLAYKYLDQQGVSVGLYGDGASNQGQVFEAYNIAHLWKIPAIFVCENNKYGMGTSAERSSANTKYYTRGDYLPGMKIDAMDVLAVRNATEYAREYALNEGPIVLEMETYRYHGHSMSDPDTTYREKEEIKDMRSNFDPILGLKAKMIEQGWATEAELKAYEKNIRAEVTKAVKFSEAQPEPPVNNLITDILAGEKMRGVRGCDITVSYDEL